MSIPKFEFTRRWTEPEDFPTVESSEAQVRADMQALHDEMRDFVNQQLLQAVDEAIDQQQAWTEQAVAEAVLGEVPDGSVAGEKLAAGVVNGEKLAEGAVETRHLAPEARAANPQPLMVGQQRYDGSEPVTFSSEGLAIDGGSAAALGLGSGATMEQALQTLSAGLSAARLCWGSYTGSGGVGAGAPTVLSFDFVPRLLLVGRADQWLSHREDSYTNAQVWIEGVERSIWQNNTGSDYRIWLRFAREGRSVKLWAELEQDGDVAPGLNGEMQCNAAGVNYVYLAVGTREGA